MGCGHGQDLQQGQFVGNTRTHPRMQSSDGRRRIMTNKATNSTPPYKIVFAAGSWGRLNNNALHQNQVFCEFVQLVPRFFEQ
jgi:hypothetical protein